MLFSITRLLLDKTREGRDAENPPGVQTGLAFIENSNKVKRYS